MGEERRSGPPPLPSRSVRWCDRPFVGYTQDFIERRLSCTVLLICRRRAATTKAACHLSKKGCAAITLDRDLIRGCQEGDVGAWKRLLDRYERLVFSVPRRYGLSVEDAADITQLTFTILVQSIDTLPEESSLGAWLATVARRHTWRLLKRKRREEISEYGNASEPPALSSTSATEELERWELAEWLHHGLSVISKACRDLLSVLYLEPERPSYAEVAARLGMAVGSVGPTRNRCLKHLRKILSEE
jgi:RNA polymerase sigma factor (sigma-70 family)